MKNFFLLFTFLFLITNPSFSQNTIHVPADYPTIQAGIDAANNGDIVLVADGIYIENINFNGKAITVASHFFVDGDESHIENTIIDGSQPSNPNLASVVILNQGEDTLSVLQGFNITGGSGTFAYGFMCGGGIYIDHTSPKILNNIVEGNLISSTINAAGGGILANIVLSPLIIKNNIIRNNLAKSTSGSAHGGGISIWSHLYSDTGRVIVENNLIENNSIVSPTFNNGGGISVYGYDDPNFWAHIISNRIIGNSVDTNITDSYGGGMTLVNTHAYTENNIIAYNTSYDAAGIDNANLGGQSSTYYINNTFCYNHAVGEEGAISTFHLGQMINCIAWGNTPQQFTPWSQVLSITYSLIGEPYTGEGNIVGNPYFLDSVYFFMDLDSTLCIDGGNSDPMYNDVEDPNNPGFALYPAQGTLINDIGHFGGPHSNWANVLSDTLYVPDDYSTIQGAIDAAIAGNTILVADGTYYENINYKGKAITVASHFFIDGDSTHIENTIIDGSQPSHPDSGSAVFFVNGEDASSVLCGFTITGGTGTVSLIWNDRSGGGVYVELSGATICNNIIEFNSITHDDYTNAGGISIVDSDSIIVENNVIRNNTITGNNWSAGGGIAIYDFTQMGYAKVANNKILNNTATDPHDASGGGIEINGGSNSFFIIGNYIKGNECSGYAGGIDFYDCIPIVKNNLIIENTAPDGGGVVFDAIRSASAEFKECNGKERSSRYNRQHSNKSIQSKIQFAAAFENNTIVNNTATISGGGITVWSSTPQLMNFIVWGNTAPSDPQISGTVDIQYSDVEGGYVGTGNIDENPIFISTNEYFLLDATSPCIDAGNPDPIYFDVGAGGNALPPAQGSLVNDMGHLGGPASLWYLWDWPMPVEDESTVLSDYTLFQNYPNPFNPTTTIKYGISERSFVELKVYDILGREVELLINEEQDAGYYEINFDAAKLSSGVYLYQLKAGQFIETRKMLLLK